MLSCALPYEIHLPTSLICVHAHYTVCVRLDTRGVPISDNQYISNKKH